MLKYNLTHIEKQKLSLIPCFNRTIFSFKRGWYDLVKNLGIDILDECMSDTGLSKLKFVPEIREVKEKFGIMSIHFKDGELQKLHSTSKDKILDLCRKTEKESQYICEYCGEFGELISDNGLWKTLCKNHTDTGQGIKSIDEYE